MADSNLARHLKQQIDMIRDTAESKTYDVIVRMNRPGDDETSLISTIAGAARQRGLSISSRDFLPVSRAALVSGTRPNGSPRNAASRELREDTRSIGAQILKQAGAAASGVSMDTLRQRSHEALRPLLASAAVREAGSARSRGKKTEPASFWTSNSAVIQVSDQDLPKIVDSVQDIEDIYPNRRLFVPPVAVPRKLPALVEDIKAGSWGLRKTGALAAWGAYEARGKGVLVGLLDTGVDANHPDLKDKIAHWAEFDATGKQIKNSKPHDSDRHGTHCAGTIAGGNASRRWIGMAPEAKIAAALVLQGRLGGTDAQILAGIDWAVNLGVDIISMSLGGLVLGPEVPSTYTSAIMSALRVGIPVVAAIGNEGSQTSGSPGSDYFAFAVGATDTDDRAAGFSGGRTQVIRTSRFFPQEALPVVYSKPDVSAPGVAIWSSIPTGPGIKEPWEHFNGTSMAAPHVAGAIALLLSATNIKNVDAGDRAFLIQDLLTGSAEELGEAGQNHRFGFGRIDVLRAIGFAKELGY